MNSANLRVMFRKVQITVLMLFSFCIIILGGYNCSTKINYPDSSTNVGFPDSPTSSSSSSSSVDELDSFTTESLLPPESSKTRCNRSQYTDLEKKFGASSFIRFDAGSLLDYRFGIDANFDLKCTRMYLNITENRRNRYQGSLILSYEADGRIKWQKHTTGSNADENKYNKWSGRDKSPSSSGRLNSKFYGIFESSDSALILVINNLIQKDIRDGETQLIGSGEIWYKMFRGYVNKQDVCYRKGTYISQVRQVPPRVNVRCWFLNQGPYSCKPKGVVSEDFDLSDRDYDCYDKLGVFGNLDVIDAFNVGSGDDYPY